MSHPHNDGQEPSDFDPTYSARLGGGKPPIDNTEIEVTPTPLPETLLEDKEKLTVAEKMWLIRGAYGFIPLSDKEVSFVYAIGKRQSKLTPLGAATRKYLQSIHIHQMSTNVEDTSKSVRAVTHIFEENLESADRQRHFTTEFEEAIYEEGTFEDDQTTLGKALRDGEAVQDMEGPLKGKRYVEAYIKRVNSMINPDNSEIPRMPEDVMKLTLAQMQLVFNKMRVENVARFQFWDVVCVGAAQHKMAHGSLKETVALGNQ